MLFSFASTKDIHSVFYLYFNKNKSSNIYKCSQFTSNQSCEIMRRRWPNIKCWIMSRRARYLLILLSRKGGMRSVTPQRRACSERGEKLPAAAALGAASWPAVAAISLKPHFWKFKKKRAQKKQPNATNHSHTFQVSTYLLRIQVIPHATRSKPMWESENVVDQPKVGASKNKRV